MTKYLRITYHVDGEAVFEQSGATVAPNVGDTVSMLPDEDVYTVRWRHFTVGYENRAQPVEIGLS